MTCECQTRITELEEALEIIEIKLDHQSDLKKAHEELRESVNEYNKSVKAYHEKVSGEVESLLSNLAAYLEVFK